MLAKDWWDGITPLSQTDVELLRHDIPTSNESHILELTAADYFVATRDVDDSLRFHPPTPAHLLGYKPEHQLKLREWLLRGSRDLLRPLPAIFVKSAITEAGKAALGL